MRQKRELQMGLNRAIQVAAFLAILAASTGRLPNIIRQVKVAQLKLLKHSQSASWGKAILLPASSK